MQTKSSNQAKLAKIRKQPLTRNMPAVVARKPIVVRFSGDGIALLARSEGARDSGIVGSLMKFKKGEFLIDHGAKVIPIGTRLVLRDVRRARCRFEDGDLVEVIPFITAESYPARETLGHLDQSKWPVMNGKPSDPWNDSRYCWFFDERQMTDYTFVTGTDGGVKAVQRLCTQVQFKRDMFGTHDFFAKIELQCGDYQHKTFNTKVQFPDFPIVGLVGLDLRPIDEEKLARGTYSSGPAAEDDVDDDNANL